MVSCVRDVEIDLEDLPDRIVLNASVCPGKEVCAHLSKTWFIMDSVPDFELSDAKVRVYVNDEFQGLMRNDDLPEDSIHSRGQYVLPGCFVRQGDCLRIEAEADGYEPVSGETRIPGRARIYEVDTLILSEISDNKIESAPNLRNMAINFRRSLRRSASACRFVMVRAEYLSPGCN